MVRKRYPREEWNQATLLEWKTDTSVQPLVYLRTEGRAIFVTFVYLNSAEKQNCLASSILSTEIQIGQNAMP